MNKDSTYNAKRGSTVLRVQLVPSDDEKEWNNIRDDLIKKSGDAKTGIKELYQFAKKSGYFD